MAISSSEARYIVESCLADFRIDGRSRLEHRPYAIANRSTQSRTTTGGAAPTLILSNGSSRVHLPGSSTDVLCSVKADLVHPSPKKPNEGVVELGVDLSLCGGGGSVRGVASSNGGQQRRAQREEESQISSLLQRLVLPHAVDYETLAVWPGRYVWRLAVDVVVLRCDGCVLDASSVAVREALRNTRLPQVKAVMDGADNDKGGNGNGGGGSSSRNDLMVDGDFKSAAPPVGAEDCPLVATVSVLTAPPSAIPENCLSKGGKKRQRHRSVSVVDARTEEEACASSRVCVSVDPRGNVCGVHTLGGGSGASLQEGGQDENGGVSSSSMPLAMLGDIVNSAAKACENLYRLLDRDGEGSDVGRRNEVSEDDGCGYGYLLKDRFLIQ
eukprot:CAMPEP_0172534350 /NCGR_PEP_ID=MMETSP1067-20121228/6748_1 /TAXON_ID=265564 ORGANISM="Thalassiosira punctigera, Strain Tpunct2005C2" /NCGR_SAMPLE_ID=MMETSP1067 /ASSEMBLY_ACC=CAM_ASM_000444 /LENGTH=383 /DNA_ID=CAMNT_0013319129 /DNA_START=15 /DNA_END=1166 /DNA_ORIENTATION=+